MAFDYDAVYQEGWNSSLAVAMCRLQFQTDEDDELEATKVNFATSKEIFLKELKTDCLKYPMI